MTREHALRRCARCLGASLAALVTGAWWPTGWPEAGLAVVAGCGAAVLILSAAWAYVAILASAIDTQSATIAGRGPQDESAAPQEDAHTPQVDKE
jgi:hypothetical protein